MFFDLAFVIMIEIFLFLQVESLFVMLRLTTHFFAAKTRASLSRIAAATLALQTKSKTNQQFVKKAASASIASVPAANKKGTVVATPATKKKGTVAAKPATKKKGAVVATPATKKKGTVAAKPATKKKGTVVAAPATKKKGAVARAPAAKKAAAVAAPTIKESKKTSEPTKKRIVKKSPAKRAVAKRATRRVKTPAPDTAAATTVAVEETINFVEVVPDASLATADVELVEEVQQANVVEPAVKTQAAPAAIPVAAAPATTIPEAATPAVPANQPIA